MYIISQDLKSGVSFPDGNHEQKSSALTLYLLYSIKEFMLNDCVEHL